MDGIPWRPLLLILLVIICGGAADLLVRRAPFFQGEYKAYARWFILLIVIVLILFILVRLLTGSA